MNVVSSELKRKRTIQTVQSLKTFKCVKANGMGNLHICEATINAERYTYKLWSNICCHQDDAKPHSAPICLLNDVNE